MNDDSGQKLDERHNALAAKVAELAASIALKVDTSTLEAALAEIEGELQTHAESIGEYESEFKKLWDAIKKINGQPLEPTPAPTDPATPHFDLSGVPSTLTPGQLLTVPAIGLPDGAEVWVHSFTRNWEDLVVGGGTVKGERVGFDVPERTGERILQLQSEKTKAHVEVTVIDAPDAVIDPVIDAPVVITPTPTGEYEATARWDVVPEQQAPERIGVVAHHVYGMDRVEFSFNGGSPIVVDEPSINPVTGVLEYHVETPKTSDPFEVTAIAHPKQGIARVLEPITLNQPQQVIDLPGGEVDAQSLVQAGPGKGWLIFRGHADGTTLVGRSRGWDEHIAFRNLAWKPGPSGGMANSKNDGNDWIWFDGVKVVGNGRGDTTWWTSHLWSRSIFTDCDLSKLQNVFHGGAGDLLARNVKISDCYEDVFRAMGLAVNITIDGIDRGDEKYHPAVFSFSREWTHRNHIFQNIKGSNVQAAGLSGGKVDGVALVDVKLDVSGHKAFYMLDLRNMLIQDTEIIGGGAFRENNFDGVVIRRSRLGWQEPFLPANMPSKGVEVVR